MSDPVQSAKDEYFYFRSGDDFHKASYEMIKRLFASSNSPDITISFNPDSIKKEKDGSWNFTATVLNKSIKIGEKIKVFFWIDNYTDCVNVATKSFDDISSLNKHLPCAYINEMEGFVYKGLSINIGNIKLKLKPRKRTILFKINHFANEVIPKTLTIKLTHTRGTFKEKIVSELYNLE